METWNGNQKERLASLSPKCVIAKLPEFKSLPIWVARVRRAGRGLDFPLQLQLFYKGGVFKELAATSLFIP